MKPLLDMTVREVLAALAPATVQPVDEWIDPRSDACPIGYRQVLDAGRRGELNVRKIGRKVLVRRSELDAWIDAHPMQEASSEPRAEDAPPESHIERLMRLNGYEKAEQALERDLKKIWGNQ